MSRNVPVTIIPKKNISIVKHACTMLVGERFSLIHKYELIAVATETPHEISGKRINAVDLIEMAVRNDQLSCSIQRDGVGMRIINVTGSKIFMLGFRNF